MVSTLGATQVAPVMDTFFRLAYDIFVAHDGVVDKFMGDATMAFFNVPVRHTDHVVRAVSAARRLQEAVGRMNERKDQPPIEIGIGVATGFAVAGRIGSDQPSDYTVVGEVVNIAARIQEAAGGGEILVTRDVYEAVESDFPNARRSVYRLKGIDEPVVAYTLS